jgi:hypothetical protein
VDLVIVLQQRNCWLKAIVLEELNFKRSPNFDEYMECLKKSVPEADAENELRFGYWLYINGEWKVRNQSLLIPITDYHRLISIYNSIKMGVTEVAEDIGLEQL